MTEDEKKEIKTQLEIARTTESVIEKIQRQVQGTRDYYGIPELNQVYSLLDQVTTRLLTTIEKLEDAEKEVADD